VVAEEQASLHRVAALIAHGAEPQVVFDAVCAETGKLIRAPLVILAQFVGDGACSIVAGWSARDAELREGAPLGLGRDTVPGLVHATGAPARIDNHEGATSELGVLTRALGICSAVGAPITIGGQVWGALQAATDMPSPLPPETEQRLSRFTDLVATAISNAAARAALIASRARLVAAGDEARRRIERNLHDGVQQQLMVLSFHLRALEDFISDEATEARQALDRIHRQAESVFEEIRQVSRGLHPAVLARGGLRAALRTLARTSPIPVKLTVDLDVRLPEVIEICAYYVVAECLTNAAKHSGADEVAVDVRLAGTTLRATIEDHGRGGVDARSGSGLTGLIDRVEAIGGLLTIESPAGSGTRVAIELPIRDPVGSLSTGLGLERASDAGGVRWSRQ
jgi:signal transduction histidine kinase